MVKILWLFMTILVSMPASQSFEETCLKCHLSREIPNEVIYKRYLLKYSSDIRMKKAMASYLKNPTEQDTVMPPQFIDIFGLKEALTLSDAELNKYIDEFINKYDLKRKLTLPKK